MKFKGIFLASVSVLSMAGCGSTSQNMSDEERKAMTNLMNRVIGSAQGMSPQQALLGNQQIRTQQPVVEQEPVITESELLAKKEKIDQFGGAAEFKRKKDGILIDGQMYVDYEGTVSHFGGNRISGEFTYSIENYDGTHTLKYFKANSTESPIKIATVRKKGERFEVRTITGKTFTGSYVVPTSDGFIISRSGSAFRYIIGNEKISSISLLDNYHVAKYQNGDVASTGYILLEKHVPKNKDGASNLFSKLSRVGADLGFSKHDDYVLVNINDGTVVPLDISVEGKDVAQYSNCRKKNSIVNECDNVRFVDSLYDKYGLPNNSHYFWAVDWTLTKSGPLAFYKTGTKVKVVDIKNKQVHTLFSRTLGVNNFRLVERADGSVGIKAQLGFSSDKLDNVEMFIKTNRNEIEAMQSLGE